MRGFCEGGGEDSEFVTKVIRRSNRRERFIVWTNKVVRFCINPSCVLCTAGVVLHMWDQG